MSDALWLLCGGTLKAAILLSAASATVKQHVTAVSGGHPLNVAGRRLASRLQTSVSPMSELPRALPPLRGEKC